MISFLPRIIRNIRIGPWLSDVAIFEVAAPLLQSYGLLLNKLDVGVDRCSGSRFPFELFGNNVRGPYRAEKKNITSDLYDHSR